MSDKTYPNETLRLLLERTSCRSFTDQAIPQDVLHLVLQAGVHAPSGGNLQPYSIIKIEKPETKEWLADKCGQGFIGQAPVLLLFCLDFHRLQRWAELETAPFTATSSFRHFWISFQDTLICAQNICTAADALGLGSVYIGTVLEFFAELQERCQLPQGVFPVVLLCLGYPKSRPQPRRKLGIETIVHDEIYQDPSDQELQEAFQTKYPTLRLEATPERLETIEQVCRETHGEAFARRCLERIEENGYINAVQRYFGLHYVANFMPQGNPDYLKMFPLFGFHWFTEFQPPEE